MPRHFRGQKTLRLRSNEDGSFEPWQTPKEEQQSPRWLKPLQCITPRCKPIERDYAYDMCSTDKLQSSGRLPEIAESITEDNNFDNTSSEDEKSASKGSSTCGASSSDMDFPLLGSKSSGSIGVCPMELHHGSGQVLSAMPTRRELVDTTECIKGLPAVRSDSLCSEDIVPNARHSPRYLTKDETSLSSASSELEERECRAEEGQKEEESRRQIEPPCLSPQFHQHPNAFAPVNSAYLSPTSTEDWGSRADSRLRSDSLSTTIHLLGTAPSEESEETLDSFDKLAALSFPMDTPTSVPSLPTVDEVDSTRLAFGDLAFSKSADTGCAICPSFEKRRNEGGKGKARGEQREPISPDREFWENPPNDRASKLKELIGRFETLIQEDEYRVQSPHARHFNLSEAVEMNSRDMECYDGVDTAADGRDQIDFETFIHSVDTGDSCPPIPTRQKEYVQSKLFHI